MYKMIAGCVVVQIDSGSESFVVAVNEFTFERNLFSFCEIISYYFGCLAPGNDIVPLSFFNTLTFAIFVIVICSQCKLCFLFAAFKFERFWVLSQTSNQVDGIT